MRTKHSNRELIRKIAFTGLFTALTAALSVWQFKLIGASITLVLPIVVIGGALFGPLVGAWLTVIPNIIALNEAGIFLEGSPIGCVTTMLLKGILAGYLAAFVYKILSKKHPIGAVACSAVIAPIVNSAVYVIGCYLFIWDELVARAGESGVGIGMLLFGLAGLNCIVEVLLNVILCPTILRVIKLLSQKKV